MNMHAHAEKLPVWTAGAKPADSAANHSRLCCARRYPQDSTAAYLLRLTSGHKLRLRIYLCYDEPQPTPARDGGGGGGSKAPSDGSGQHAW